MHHGFHKTFKQHNMDNYSNLKNFFYYAANQHIRMISEWSYDTEYVMSF